MKNTKQNQKGVSLLEILVVITIFSVLAILTTRGVLLTLQGSRKSDSLARVRENVDYAFSVMERHIRNADDVSCISSTQLSYQTKDGDTTTFSCESVGLGDGYIASGSARLTNEEVDISSCSFTCEAATSGVPPAVSISVTGQDANIEGIEEGLVTESTKIYLRTY
jgi:prepilin-type N-terminal cleavage/methylation domain-containing protein